MKQHPSNTLLAVVLFATAIPLFVLVLAKTIPPLETAPEEKAPAQHQLKEPQFRKKQVLPSKVKKTADVLRPHDSLHFRHFPLAFFLGAWYNKSNSSSSISNTVKAPEPELESATPIPQEK